LQVNRSPSFGTDEQLDYDIKSAVIEDALRLVNIRSDSAVSSRKSIGWRYSDSAVSSRKSIECRFKN